MTLIARLTDCLSPQEMRRWRAEVLVRARRLRGKKHMKLDHELRGSDGLLFSWLEIAAIVAPHVVASAPRQI